jgi:lactate dehydrogenase-like 2-hydroxyacid dehydrogenase
MQARVFVTRRLPEAVEARLQASFDARLNLADEAYTREQLLAGANDADAILTAPTENWDAGLIEAFGPRPRMIATYSVGHDHIALEACQRRGIIVSNTPDVLTEATADITMLCLLGAARRAWEGEAMLRLRRWQRWTPTELRGLGLGGKTLGIVGIGRIGQAVAQRARGFGLSIHYYNRSRLPADEERGAVYHGTLDDLLPHCEFLSLNCPGGEETRHMMNARTLALLPPGAVLVNTARGTLVDDEALIAALRSGHLFAAGLDVYDGEPDFHAGYETLPNAFLLPHLGSATIEARDAMGFRCLDNLDAFFRGDTPPDKLP